MIMRWISLAAAGAYRGAATRRPNQEAAAAIRASQVIIVPRSCRRLRAVARWTACSDRRSAGSSSAASSTGNQIMIRRGKCRVGQARSKSGATSTVKPGDLRGQMAWEWTSSRD